MRPNASDHRDGEPPVGCEPLSTFFNLDKIRVIQSPLRVTGPLLDVLDVLFSAYQDCAENLHGWPIMKATKRSGPTVYGVLDRLEDMGWISGQWEAQDPDSNKPRRRIYRLTPTGAEGAEELLRLRRPNALQAKPSRQLPGWRTVPGQAGAT